MQRKKGFSISQLFLYIGLSAWAVTTVYPFLWAIINSFKTRAAIRENTFALPNSQSFTFEHYISAWDRVHIPDAYVTSLVISCTVTVAVLLLSGMAAYGLARYRFKGRKVLHSLVIGSMMFPVFSTIIPVFRMLNNLNLVHAESTFYSRLCVILPQIAGNLSFSIIVLMGFIRSSIPVELEEAAYIEGYSVYQIFFRIVMPLAKPSFATVGIFAFLWSYNDLFTQMFFLQNQRTYSITRLLNEISSQAGTNNGLLCAAIVFVVVPVLIVYICLQKNIVKGLTAGAVKG